MMSPKRLCLLIAAVAALLSCAPKVTVREISEPTPVLSQEALYNTAQSLMDAGETAQAMELFDQYLTQFPQGARADAALMQMAAIHEGSGNWAAARSIYGRLVRSYPDSALVSEAKLKILAAYFHEGKYETVIRAFSDIGISQFSPDQAQRAHVYAGDACWIIGNSAQAASFYIRAYGLAADTKVQRQLASKITEALRLLSPSEIAALLDETASDEDRQLIEALARPFAYNRFSLGCLLPLSGRYATYGQRALKGVELALSCFTAGDAAPDFTIAVKDSGGDPEKAARSIRELATQDRVAGVIGSLITAETAALEAQLVGLPIITLTQKDRISQIGDWVFRNFFTPRMQVETVVGYCSRELGLKRFAILYPDEPYGQRFMNLFWDAVIAAGGTIVGVESYDKKLTDFADPIKKLVGLYYELPKDLKYLRRRPHPTATADAMIGAMVQDSDPDPPDAAAEETEKPEPVVDFEAVFIPDAPKKVGLIIPQLAFYDIRDTYLLGTNLWYSDHLIDMTRQYVQGAIVPVGFFPHSRSGPVESFVRHFEAAYGQTPGFIEAIAYDTAMILMETAARGDVKTRVALRDRLLDTPIYTGVTGPTFFEPDGDAVKALSLIRVKGGAFVELTPADAAAASGNRP